MKHQKKHYSERLVKRTTGRRAKAHHLRGALVEAGIKYECSECKISEWNNKPLVLQVDHINGDHCDDRKDNLRFLCPNCHTQTPNHSRPKNGVKKFYCECGKEIKRNSRSCRSCAAKKQPRKVKNRPSIDQINKDIKTLNIEGTGRKYGVSGNTIRKWIKNQ